VAAVTIEEQVERYLDDCAQIKWLNPKYHPTAAGACKMIPHNGDKETAALIKAAFGKLRRTLP
jgi:hypothetical protein